MRPQAVWWRGCRHARQIHKPSARVSFGLPDPLSFQVRSHVMVARRSGIKLDRESVRVRLPSSLTRRLGNAMRASQKSKRKKEKANRRSPVAPRHCRWPRTIWSIWLPSLSSVARFCSPFWLQGIFETCRTQKCRHRRSCRRRLVPAALPDLQTAWARRICGWQGPMRGI